MLKRRTLLALAAAALATPAAAMDSWIAYTPGAIQTALDQGKTVFVDYAADWCSTCQTQERTISALRAENPAYDDAMVFIRVDWDDYGSHEVATSRSIPRRSTLLVLHGDAELGRIVAGTSKSDIAALMNVGLNAAS